MTCARGPACLFLSLLALQLVAAPGEANRATLAALYEHALAGMGCSIDIEVAPLVHVQNAEQWGWVAQPGGTLPASLRMLAADGMPTATATATATTLVLLSGLDSVSALAPTWHPVGDAATVMCAAVNALAGALDARVPAPSSRLLDEVQRHQPAGDPASPHRTAVTPPPPSARAAAFWTAFLHRVCGELAPSDLAPPVLRWRRAVLLDQVQMRLGVGSRAGTVTWERYASQKMKGCQGLGAIDLTGRGG